MLDHIKFLDKTKEYWDLDKTKEYWIAFFCQLP